MYSSFVFVWKKKRKVAEINEMKWNEIKGKILSRERTCMIIFVCDSFPPIYTGCCAQYINVAPFTIFLPNPHRSAYLHAWPVQWNQLVMITLGSQLR